MKATVFLRSHPKNYMRITCKNYMQGWSGGVRLIGVATRLGGDDLWGDHSLRYVICFLLFFGLRPALTAAAQQGNSTPGPASAAQEDRAKKGSDPEKEIEKREQSQRALGVLPQFGVTSRNDAPPLTPQQKFHLFTKSAFDPVTIGIVGLQAGISQAGDEFPGYGQGAQGYGKRFGASFADNVSSGFWVNFLYPTILKEDPRYFRMGEGSTIHRLRYSLTQEFICHTDKGGRSFSWSNTLGALTGGGLSNVYYPPSDRGFGLTMSRSGVAMLYGSMAGLFDEFWPDINRKFHKHQKTQPAP
jgi:hypothetical protein